MNIPSELLISRQNKIVPLTDDVLQYLDTSKAQHGVYESIRTYHREPFMLDEHLDRLQHSAQQLGFSPPESLENIKEWTFTLIKQAPFDPQFLKLVVIEKEVLIFSRKLEFAPELYKGVKVITTESVRENPGVKQLAVLSQHEARQEAEKQGAYEALVCDNEGNFTEGAYSNLFWKRGGQWFTCRTKALPGITQSVVAQIIQEDQPVLESVLKPDQISQLEECFLTQTSKGIVPILQVDDILVRDGTIGAQTKRFLKRFEALTSSS